MNIRKEFEIELEITGFKLKIGGSRDDIPLMSQNLTRQIAGFITPAANIVQGEATPSMKEQQDGSQGTVKKTLGKGRKSAQKAQTQSVNWNYDGQAYGTPQQGWSTADKSIWLLYVARRTSGTEVMSTGQIVTTFNAHYRDAKQILSANVSRDLSKLRVEDTAPVGKNENGWFLTQEGQRWADKLIAGLQN